MEVALLGPVLGWLLDRFGPKVFVRAGIFVFGLGLCILSQVETLAAFYGAFIVIALGRACAASFRSTSRSTGSSAGAHALSAMSFGLAFGGIMVPLVAASIAGFGWRPTAFASGIIAIVVGLPLALVIRNNPREIGEVVDAAGRDIARGNRTK